MKCVNSIKIKHGHDSKCKPPCSGLIISSFTKSEPNEKFEKFVTEKFQEYDKYIKWFQFPSGLKGLHAKIKVNNLVDLFYRLQMEK